MGEQPRANRRHLSRTAVRALLAVVAVGLAAWATSEFQATWSEIAAAAGLVAIVIVAGSLFGAADQDETSERSSGPFSGSAPR